VRDNSTRLFNFDWSAFGGWHLLGGVTRRQQLSEQPFLAEQDFQSTGPEAGIMYQMASGSTVTLTRRERAGRFLNRDFDPAGLIDNGYREHESELKLHWTATGRTTIDAVLGRIERRHDHFAERDFAGLYGDFTYAVTLPGKLSLSLSAKRVLAPALGTFSSYRTDRLLTVAPAWQITDKTVVRASLEQTTSDFLGPVVASPGPPRHDVTRSARLSADWAPTKSSVVTASVKRVSRASNDASVVYKTTIANVGLTWSF
jgi:hypothetical protein